eukprot:scaffold24261_cov51-Phaeocystis_antarctica.AAC.3
MSFYRVGEEGGFEFPRARPHQRRRRLLRRLHPVHDHAHCGEQAGRGQPPRRVPTAVAASAPGLQGGLASTAAPAF